MILCSKMKKMKEKRMKLRSLLKRCFVRASLCISMLLASGVCPVSYGWTGESTTVRADGVETRYEVNYDCTWSESESGVVFCQASFDKYEGAVFFDGWPEKDLDGKIVMGRRSGTPVGAVLVVGHNFSEDKAVTLGRGQYVQTAGGLECYVCSSENPIKVGNAMYNVHLGFSPMQGASSLFYALEKRG